jgi:hypothetical protein
VRYALYFAVCLPTDTTISLLHGEDGLLRGKNCKEQQKHGEKRCGCWEKGISEL